MELIKESNGIKLYYTPLFCDKYLIKYGTSSISCDNLDVAMIRFNQLVNNG